LFISKLTIEQQQPYSQITFQYTQHCWTPAAGC